MFILQANIINFNSIKIKVISLPNFAIEKLTVLNGTNSLAVKNYSITEDSILLETERNINIKNPCTLLYDGNPSICSYLQLYKSQEFNNKYFTNEALGCFYYKNYTTFKVWSPPASLVTLLLYSTGDSLEAPRAIEMNENNGLWNVSVQGDLKGFYYTYEVVILNEKHEAVDPYAKAVGINGLRAAIINMDETTPADFYNIPAPKIKNYTDAILYEVSIRDITGSKTSGVKNRGKYLGLAEENTFSPDGLPTGLNHIKELGITHVQLMPIFDFSYMSVDEKNSEKYNWGYDPQNLNAPEGSYSTNPYNPTCRIYELKELIKTLHKNGLCVVMDMVYNHVYHNTENSFEKIFPGYYFRYDNSGKRSDGSGCGNDIASEQPMAAKFIVDSVLYWVNEYNLDGLRFDLMGLLDVNTMNKVREALNSLRRPLMLYGEGWYMNTELSEDLKANMFNSYKLPSIGHFNDSIRDGVKGSVFSKEDKGFISGKQGQEETIKKCITGFINYSEKYKGLFITPSQSVNYVSAHDNNTLWDKLQCSNPQDNFEDKKSMHKLANAVVLMSQGIPFLHSGVEFCRTKNGIENSYNSPDEINNINWLRKAEFYDVFNYYKGLINIRKQHAAFRFPNAEGVKAHLSFIENVPNNVIAFTLSGYANNDSWDNILVIFNANRSNVKLNIPFAKWNVTTDKYIAGTETLRILETDSVEVEGLSFNLFHN